MCRISRATWAPEEWYGGGRHLHQSLTAIGLIPAPDRIGDLTLFAYFPVPIPENFVPGLDVQQRDFERLRLPNYLFGETKSDGWSSYYFCGLFLKSPFAIATNVLSEMPVSVIGSDGRFTEINRQPFAQLRSTEPVGWAGDSIRIFSADQLRRAFEAPSKS